MPKAKQDKYDLLASVIDAIYDENKKVVIETVNDGRYDDEPKIPSKWLELWGAHSMTWARAQSIKVGNISMKRIPVKKSGLDYACTYIVRTPEGEAEFTNNDTDFKQVWYAALGRYEAEHKDKRRYYEVMWNVMKTLHTNVKHNPKLEEAAGKGIVRKDTKSKYEAAIEQLKQMGVQPKRLAAYIEKKSSQNG